MPLNNLNVKKGTELKDFITLFFKIIFNYYFQKNIQNKESLQDVLVWKLSPLRPDNTNHAQLTAINA